MLVAVTARKYISLISLTAAWSLVLQQQAGVAQNAYLKASCTEKTSLQTSSHHAAEHQQQVE